MLKEKIVKSIGKRANKDLSLWYKGKVLELSGFLLKKAKEEGILVESNKSFESRRLEVVLK